MKWINVKECVALRLCACNQTSVSVLVDFGLNVDGMDFVELRELISVCITWIKHTATRSLQSWSRLEECPHPDAIQSPNKFLAFLLRFAVFILNSISRRIFFLFNQIHVTRSFRIEIPLPAPRHAGTIARIYHSQTSKRYENPYQNRSFHQKPRMLIAILCEIESKAFSCFCFSFSRFVLFGFAFAQIRPYL